ncbi:MAG: hypothetical protein P8Z49_05185 [Acidobacteriota bacterium]
MGVIRYTLLPVSVRFWLMSGGAAVTVTSVAPAATVKGSMTVAPALTRIFFLTTGFIPTGETFTS